jgi:hypothetical protein
MKRLAFAFSFLFSLVALSAQVEYPTWFRTGLPDGWAAVFAHSSEEAASVAAKVLCTYELSQVEGDFQQFYDDKIDSRSWRNTGYYYIYDQRKVNDREKRLAVFDSLPINIITGVVLFLVGPKDGKPVETGKLENLAHTPRPAWADKIAFFEAKDGRSFGVGRFSLQGNPADAWVKAEENAVLQVLLLNLLKIGQSKIIDKSDSGDSLSKVSWIKLHHYLSQLRIEARWIDPEYDEAMVLVSVPAKAIRGID